MSAGVARAREELFAAHLLATTGFAAQCVALCFRAALAAAEEALVLLDRPPHPQPAAVVSAFVTHVVRGRGLDPRAGQRLRSLLNRAELANADGAVPQPEAAMAIADATEVVDTVATWVEKSRQVAGERARARPGPRAGPRPPR
jgi:hypothetical protein